MRSRASFRPHQRGTVPAPLLWRLVAASGFVAIIWFGVLRGSDVVQVSPSRSALRTYKISVAALVVAIPLGATIITNVPDGRTLPSSGWCSSSECTSCPARAASPRSTQHGSARWHAPKDPRRSCRARPRSVVGLLPVPGSALTGDEARLRRVHADPTVFNRGRTGADLFPGLARWSGTGTQATMPHSPVTGGTPSPTSPHWTRPFWAEWAHRRTVVPVRDPLAGPYGPEHRAQGGPRLTVKRGGVTRVGGQQRPRGARLRLCDPKGVHSARHEGRLRVTGGLWVRVFGRSPTRWRA